QGGPENARERPASLTRATTSETTSMFKTGQIRPSARCFSIQARAKALAVILAEELGVPFRFYDAAEGQEISVPGGPSTAAGPAARERLSPERAVSLGES